MKNYIRKTLAVFAIMAATGCAKNAADKDSDANRRYIDAWIETMFPGLKPQGIGYYVIPEYERKGTGKDIGGDQYVFVDYTKTDFEGNVKYSTIEDVNKQTGSYAESSYYGPAVIDLKEGSSPAGLEYSMKGLKVGAHRRVILPLWTNTTKRFTNDDDYIKKVTTGENVIYDFTVMDSCEDIFKWQVDSLERYKKERLGNVDSLSYGFYLYNLREKKDSPVIPSDTTIFINYTGRLLNGKVFDTTIKDTAKVYGLYSAGRSYAPLEVVMNKDYTKIKLGGSTTIKGFGMAISNMSRHGKIRAAFYSELGYGATGSAPRIPVYCPLEFEIEIVDKP